MACNKASTIIDANQSQEYINYVDFQDSATSKKRCFAGCVPLLVN